MIFGTLTNLVFKSFAIQESIEQQIFESLDGEIIQLIKDGEYNCIDMSKEQAFHHFYATDDFVTSADIAPDMIYEGKDLRNEDVIVELVYFLYSKKDASKDKYLTFKLLDSKAALKLTNFLKNIPIEIIEIMVKKYEIKAFNPDFLFYKDIIGNNICLYNLVVEKTDENVACTSDSLDFYFQRGDFKVFFTIPIDQLLIPYDEIYYKENFGKFSNHLGKVQELFNDFNLDIFRTIANSNKYCYKLKRFPASKEKFQYSAEKYGKLREKSLKDKEMETLFITFGDLQDYIHETLSEIDLQNALYVYTDDEWIGINNKAYKLGDDDNDDKQISEITFNTIKNYFSTYGNSTFLNKNYESYVRSIFYGLRTSPLYKIVLNWCLRTFKSADYIILANLALHGGLIDNSEFEELMSSKTHSSVKNKFFETLLYISLSDICSEKCYFFIRYINNKMTDMYFEGLKRSGNNRSKFQLLQNEKLHEIYRLVEYFPELVSESRSLHDETLDMISKFVSKIQDPKLSKTAKKLDEIILGSEESTSN